MEATAAQAAVRDREGEKGRAARTGSPIGKAKLQGGRDECRIEGIEGRKMGEVKEAGRGSVFYVRASKAEVT